MGRLTVLFTLFAVMFLAAPGQAKNLYMNTEELKSDAERGFREIITLWRDGRYAELYERTSGGGGRTKEYFIGKLTGAEKKPVCCWDMVQDVVVKVKDDGEAVVYARIGLETALKGTEYSTRSFKMVKDDGVWLMTQSDLLSLSGAKKKGTHKKGKKRKHAN